MVLAISGLFLVSTTSEEHSSGERFLYPMSARDIDETFAQVLCQPNIGHWTLVSAANICQESASFSTVYRAF